MKTVTTLQLMPGDRVLLPGGIVRTVSKAWASPFRNSRNVPIWQVMWREGRTPEWSAGNSAAASSAWRII